MITVTRAPAYLVVQDRGRDGYRGQGVPPGGALDRLSLDAGNALLGNQQSAAALEWSLTGGALRFEDHTALVLTGAESVATLRGTTLQRNQVTRAKRGDVLDIQRLLRGRFLYVCVAGGIDVPMVLGGRGTYLPGKFGGFSGRRIATGDLLPVGNALGPANAAELPLELDVLSRAPRFRLLSGPQAKAVSARDWKSLLDADLSVSDRSDRVGYRLNAPPLQRTRIADMQSEPTCVGAVQLPPSGEPIALMADGPTVGGYPKIGIVASTDIPRLAQCTPGERIRLMRTELDEVIVDLTATDQRLGELCQLTGARWGA
jgi:antagonist of KipI